jgi:hypothetical protein
MMANKMNPSAQLFRLKNREVLLMEARPASVGVAGTRG